MITKIKRGLGIVTDYKINRPSLNGTNVWTINGSYLELPELSNSIDLKNSFDKEHFEKSEKKSLDVTGDFEINQKIVSPTQLNINIKQNSNINILLDGISEAFLSSGIHINASKNVKASIKIKSELKGLQNYLRITQKQEENSEIKIGLQLYSKNQTILLFKTNLDGENTVLDKRVFIKADNSQIDSDIIITHKVPNSNSNMVVNGTLENSRLINENTIKITKDASNSKGFEHSKFILLDEKSNAISIPNLIILNEDVACSHGSTISTVDDQDLFYLQSRGVTKNDAIRLIIDGLESQVIDHVNIGSEE